MSLFISMFFTWIPSLAVNFLHEFLESCVCGDLVSSGDHASVLESVLDGPEPVPESVLGLHEGVFVGSLGQDGHWLGVSCISPRIWTCSLLGHARTRFQRTRGWTHPCPRGCSCSQAKVRCSMLRLKEEHSFSWNEKRCPKLEKNWNVLIFHKSEIHHSKIAGIKPASSLKLITS